MKRNLFTVFICICLCLTLTACGFGSKQGGGKDKPVKHTKSDRSESEISKDKEFFENLKEDALKDSEDNTEENDAENDNETGADDLAEGEDAPWKDAYLGVLAELNTVHEENWEQIGYDKIPYMYLIYDIDKDGTPEMIVEFGSCEADYNGKLYMFENGQAVEKESFGLGHTCFYSDPDENGILFYWGHMGYAYLQKASLNSDGTLSYEELLSEELDPNTDDWYTNPGLVVSGAQSLYMCRVEENLMVTHYESIYNQIDNLPEPPTRAEIIPNYIEEIVPDILDNNGKVYAVSADGYGGDLGPDVEINYLLANISEYDGAKYKLEDSAYVDMNNDKKLEAVLKVIKDEVDYVDYKWIILSPQDGTTYAYVLNYSSHYTLLENGTFSPTESLYSYFRVEFDHEHCLTYEVSEDGKHEVVIR